MRAIGGVMPILEKQSPNQRARTGRIVHIVANIFLLAFLPSSFSLRAGAAKTSFSGPVNYTFGKAPYEVVVDDFNGDGMPDLIVLSIDGNDLNVFLGKGDGTFRPAIT